MTITKHPHTLRVATEEAWAPPEMLKRYQDQVGKIDDPGYDSLWGFYGGGKSARANAVFERLGDLGERRIADMDAAGIDHQVIALTSPGVQAFDAATATDLAIVTNDELAEGIRRHPTRFSGLASFAPHDSANAAKELERSVTKLGLKGGMINSHTHGEYLDNPKFWDIFAAAEQLDVPLYLHPQTPPKAMVQPYLEAGLDGAVFGFGAETALHMMRIITSGVFDRFPRLQMVLGHMGEALPYWMFRLDYMHEAQVRAKRYECLKPLKKKISGYLRENIYVTNSGVAWEPAILFARQVLGNDRVMYAMDYPYQYEPQEVTAMDALPLSQEELHQFYQGNAERVFKLALVAR
jgi:2,3-dihydroxybenzoate decarboxylase